MVTKKLEKQNRKDTVYKLSTVDKELSSHHNKLVVQLPTKLAMIVEPKEYGADKLGGYLLNDVKFVENLFISKAGYGSPSELSENNSIYRMINKMSRVPFKINIELLDFLNNNGYQMGLLTDPAKEHSFQNLEKRTKLQERQYSSHVSKINLQETVLSLAEFYKKFPNIYFPLRLDQRGRIYCSPNYLNYQSTELAKALLLFSEPGIIERSNDSSINYLKLYGANTFGGKTSKSSFSQKAA